MNSRTPAALLLLCSTAFVLAACSTGTETIETTSSTIRNLSGLGDPPAVPALDADKVATGEMLYQEFCASCHGADLKGQPDWKTRNDDGTYRAPPHDNSGHTWHHSDQLLTEIIGPGVDIPGSSMPSFDDRLTSEDIEALLEYLKSTWGPEEQAFQWQVTWQQTQNSQ